MGTKDALTLKAILQRELGKINFPIPGDKALTRLCHRGMADDLDPGSLVYVIESIAERVAYRDWSHIFAEPNWFRDEEKKKYDACYWAYRRAVREECGAALPSAVLQQPPLWVEI